jgi:hypothetical protein
MKFRTKRGDYKIVGRWNGSETIDFRDIKTGKGNSCTVDYFNQMQLSGQIEITEL